MRPLCRSVRSSVSKHPEMNRELRRGGLAIFGEVSAASFALRQHIDHLEADRVGLCFELMARLLGIGGVLDYKNHTIRSA